MARHKQGRHAAPVAPSPMAVRARSGHGRRSASTGTPAGRSGLLTGGRVAVLAAVVAGTGAITVAQADENGAVLAEASAAEDGASLALRAQDAASRSQLAGRLAMETAATRTLVVSVDGATQELTTSATRLADALTEAGITVGADDRVSVGLGERVAPGMRVEITRVSTERVTERTVEEHGTVEKEDATLAEGRRVVETQGVDGVSSVVYEVTRAGEEEISREAVASIVVSETVDEVVRVGTKQPVAAPTPSPADAGTGSGAPSGASEGAAATYSGDARALGRDLAAARGWGADQFQCLDSLWTKESNWSHTATNPSSGAYGIPQSLPGSKMATAGADWRTNPATQITWGLNYIAGRYGTPCGAWSHSRAVGWY